VFDRDGMLAGKGWKTYALCVGVYGFYIFDRGKI
jgi:hypothetical protein